LGLAGVSSAEAGVIAIIMRVLTWALALLGGVVFLVRTMRARHEPSDRGRGGGARPAAGRMPEVVEPVDVEQDFAVTLPVID
jgi:hypothetical protein